MDRGAMAQRTQKVRQNGPREGRKGREEKEKRKRGTELGMGEDPREGGLRSVLTL